MAEEVLLEPLRRLPVNLVMVAPRKIQAIAYVAQRNFEKAVALGDEAAFGLALALRAQMDPRPRRIEEIMAALVNAEEKVLVHALNLVDADAVASDIATSRTGSATSATGSHHWMTLTC